MASVEEDEADYSPETPRPEKDDGSVRKKKRNARRRALLPDDLRKETTTTTETIVRETIYIADDTSGATTSASSTDAHTNTTTVVIPPPPPTPAPTPDTSQKMEFSLKLQQILDSPEFSRSTDYAVMKHIKRAVNPGIQLHQPVNAAPAKDRLGKMIRSFFGSQTEEVTRKKGDDDLISYPVSEQTARAIAGVMHPIEPVAAAVSASASAAESEPSSWYLGAEEFALHTFQDWQEQVDEVRFQACESLGMDPADISDSVIAVPQFLMLHIGKDDGAPTVHRAWGNEFATRNASPGNFGVLRFVLPSARSRGQDDWKLSIDAKSALCNDDPQFCTYYTAHYLNVEHTIKDLVGVRLELVYMLRFTGELAAIPRAPMVQQRLVNLLRDWDRSLETNDDNRWTACRLNYRADPPDSLNLRRLETQAMPDYRKIKLVDKLSKAWRFQYFVATLKVTKTYNTEQNKVTDVRTRIGRLRNLDDVFLEHCKSISTNVLFTISGVSKTGTADPDYTVERDGYKEYHYVRTILFLWPNKFHGTHCEPLEEGDRFLRTWLAQRKIDPSDASRLSFDDPRDQEEFASIALALCRRGSEMKPFCQVASLRIEDAALFEASLPETRGVELVQKGIEGLGLTEMKPIIMRTLDMGVPDNLEQWCRYLLGLRKIDPASSLELIQKLVQRMCRRDYVRRIEPVGQHRIIWTTKFFYEHGLPQVSEKLIMSIPYQETEFWIPFIPKLHSLCDTLRASSRPGTAAGWLDKSLTGLVRSHQLPTLAEFLALNLTVYPDKKLDYTPPSIEILRICTEYGRTDLVRHLLNRLLGSLTSPTDLARLSPATAKPELDFLRALTISIHNTLTSISAPLRPDPHGVFLGIVFTKYLLPSLGPRPPRSPYPSLSCRCLHCHQITDFLSAADSTVLPMEFPGKSAFHHILDHLPPRDDLAVTRDGETNSIIIRKIAGRLQERWEKQQAELRELRDFLKPKKIVKQALQEDYARVEAALKVGSNGWTWGVLEARTGVRLDGEGARKRGSEDTRDAGGGKRVDSPMRLRLWRIFWWLLMLALGTIGVVVGVLWEESRRGRELTEWIKGTPAEMWWEKAVERGNAWDGVGMGG